MGVGAAISCIRTHNSRRLRKVDIVSLLCDFIVYLYSVCIKVWITSTTRTAPALIYTFCCIPRSAHRGHILRLPSGVVSYIDRNKCILVSFFLSFLLET